MPPPVPQPLLRLPFLLPSIFTRASRTSSSSSLPLRLSSTNKTPNINIHHQSHPFSTHPPRQATLNQIHNNPRKPQRARHAVSPALANRPHMKAVCLRVFVMKPKKPNSAERKVAKVRLSSGRMVQCYIPGEGHNVQQHSVVLVRGGRSQDCPGVKYHLVRGAMDLGGVGNRISARSKYGTKKRKAAAS